jgi:hypothetical protein
MQLDIYVLDQHRRVEIAPEALERAQPLFDRMDADMDAGCRMGPEFIAEPNRIHRAQMAADKLLTALENENPLMIEAMSAYIAARVPEAREVHIDVGGEPLNTSLTDAQGREIFS